jgi:hypothetical protein
MANTNAPFGLRPVRHLTSACWNGQVTMYRIPSGDTAAYFVGDVVASAAGGDLVNGCSDVILFGTRGAASSSGAVRGVIVGLGAIAGNSGQAAPLGADPDALGTISIPATKTKDYYVWVCDDPSVVYEAQTDTIAAAAFNKNCPLYVAAAPSPPLFNSASYAQGSAANTTQAFPLKIIGAPDRQDNALASPGTYAKIYVIFNQHELGGPNTAGV